jgi:hypothetical protein
LPLLRGLPAMKWSKMNCSRDTHKCKTKIHNTDLHHSQSGRLDTKKQWKIKTENTFTPFY